MDFKAKTIPTPGNLPDVKSDALQVFEVLQSGGITIIPSEVGYGLGGSSVEAIEKAFAAKKRRPGHQLGIIGTYDLHREVHILDKDKFEMTRVLSQDLDMVLVIVAPYNKEHSLLKNLSAKTLDNITKNGTIAMAIGGGPLLSEICRLSYEAGQLLVGTSANVSGSGQKFTVEDIEDEIKEAADTIVDYGLQKYHIYGKASIIMDFENMKVLRMGSCYELFRERMNKFWGVQLPDNTER